MPKHINGGDQDMGREPILDEFQEHDVDAAAVATNGRHPAPVGQEDIHVTDIQGHPPLSVVLLTSSDNWNELIPRSVLTPQQVDAMKLIMADRSIVETGDINEEEIFKFECMAAPAVGGKAREQAIRAEVGGAIRRAMGGIAGGMRRALGGGYPRGNSV